MDKENTTEDFSPINVSEHLKPQYEKFRDWYLTTYASLGLVFVSYQNRFNANPLTINIQKILFDAYMSREQEIQQLRQQISQLEKASNSQNNQKKG